MSLTYVQEEERNKAVVKTFIEEFWGNGRADLATQVIDSNVIDHNEMPGQNQGIEGQKQALTIFRTAFPDLRIKLDLLLASRDHVTDRWTATGTHKGSLMGIPPTGKTIKITGIDISRVVNGKIVEIWHQEDIMSMMQQLGVVPSPQIPAD
jgi:predicted ester cyclase